MTDKENQTLKSTYGTEYARLSLATYQIACAANCVGAAAATTATTARAATADAATSAAAAQTPAKPANVLQLSDDIHQRAIGIGERALSAATHRRVQRIEPDQRLR